VIRIERRSPLPPRGAATLRLGAVCGALLLGALFLQITGHGAGQAYLDMLRGAAGSSYAVQQTIIKAIPLALAGLAVALAFHAGLWNIGAEGQLAMGAVASSWAALALPWPAWALLPSMVVLALIGGGLWAFVPAVARALFGTNEIITTLLLNYVALLWVDYLVFGPWADPSSFSFPFSRPFPDAARLPAFPGTQVHAGAIFVLIIAAGLAFVLRHTTWGYELRVIGHSPRTAIYAGMPVSASILIVMTLSGAIAGVAGFGEVSGVIGRIQQGISPGYGYSAIIIAWLARLNPWSTVAVALFFAALINGGFALQTSGVPAAIAYMLQALVLFSALVGDFFVTHHIVRRRGQAEAVAPREAPAEP
jgi:general nucleoside transport system permease protein